jgi:hypothetical protein
MEPLTKTLDSFLVRHLLRRYFIHILIYFTNILISERKCLNKKKDQHRYAAQKAGKRGKIVIAGDTIEIKLRRNRVKSVAVYQRSTARRKWYVHEARSTKGSCSGASAMG